MTAQAGQEGAEYFDSTEFALRADIEDNHYWHVHRRAVLLDALREVSAPSRTGRLLEIGCGIGTVTTHFNQNGYVCDYGDYFENAVAIAKRRAEAKLGAEEAGKRRFMQVDATKELGLEGYQGMFLFDVIEHLPDDLLVMTNVRKAVEHAADPFVIVTVPAFQFLWSPWDDVEKHKRRYTRRSLVDLLERAGFEVGRATYLFAPLFFAALGVKGLRTIRDLVAPAPKAEHMSELSEAKNVDILNKVVVTAHAPERRWLGGNRGLPFGTSVLAVARPR
jgi:SAM-dependent methyltransferase